jgi:hypothetical protein
MDGVLYSNTKFFEDNLISNSTHELEYKYFINNYSGVSGVKTTLPEEHYGAFFNSQPDPQSIKFIKPETLTNIIKSTNIGHIDLLSLDVEGHEYEVLLSYDFKIPIDVILIETLGGSQVYKENLCIELLIKNGYKFHNNFKHNKVFILDK